MQSQRKHKRPRSYGGGVRKPPRGEQYLTQRRLEHRLTPRGLYNAAREDHPSQSEFGQPEYIDGNGNELRLAVRSRPLGIEPGQPVPPTDAEERARILKESNGMVRLWVRLVHGSGINGWTFQAGHTIGLQPVRAGLNAMSCYIISATRRRAMGRTGSLVVTGFR